MTTIKLPLKYFSKTVEYILYETPASMSCKINLRKNDEARVSTNDIRAIALRVGLKNTHRNQLKLKAMWCIDFISSEQMPLNLLVNLAACVLN